MRTILFRGIPDFEIQKEWIYGSLICEADSDVMRIHSHGSDNWKGMNIRVVPESVGQFTGLHDATKWKELTEAERDKWTLEGNMPSEWKGRMIFEGDVVSSDGHHPSSPVFFKNGSYKINGKCSIVGFGSLAKLVKVIGTIHDQKLEGKN